MGLQEPKMTPNNKDLCRGFSEMTRVRVGLNMDQDYVACQSSIGISMPEAVTDGYIYSNEFTPTDMAAQRPPVAMFKKAKDIDGGNPFETNADAIKLASSLGTFKDPMNADADEYSAFCFAYIGNNLTAKYDSNNVLMHVNALKLTMSTAAELLYMNAYFVPPGEKPYRKVGNKYVVTATSVLWPLKNSLTQGQLTTEVITDTSTVNKRLPDAERVYSDKPTTTYKVSVNSQPTRLTVFSDEIEVGTDNKGQLKMVDSVVYGGNSLRFGSFVQPNIVIRDKTYAEIWAEIGGLWAGAALFITFLFKSSGYNTAGVPEDIEDTKGEPLLVSRLIPDSMVKKHLSAYKRSNKSAATSEAAVSQEPAEPSRDDAVGPGATAPEAGPSQEV
jgi:hypothetical protein